VKRSGNIGGARGGNRRQEDHWMVINYWYIQKNGISNINAADCRFELEGSSGTGARQSEDAAGAGSSVALVDTCGGCHRRHCSVDDS